MEGRLATELRGRGGGELLIMDWFSHFFQGLVFLSPSRWMVIAPPALIMCWIGEKTGGKRLYSNWESIALEVNLLLLRFITHHKSAHMLLARTCTDLHVRTNVKGEKRQLRWCLGEKEDEKKKTWEGEWGQRGKGGGEHIEQWGAGTHLGFWVSAVAGDWEKDNCFIKGVIAITSLIVHEQSTLCHLYLI